MIDSILIGKVIYSRLATDEIIKQKLTSVIKGKEVLKLYPLIANDDTTFPYIVYRKESIQPSVMKDGFYQDSVDFTIIINDINYDTCCEIANRVRNLFEWMDFSSKNLNIRNCHLINIDENWVSNAFVQMLSFTCTVTNE